MNRILIALLACAALPAQERGWVYSRELTGAVDVLAHFPLAVGNRWIYEHEYRSGDPQRPTITRWTRETSIKAHVQIPEGLLVLRESRIRDVQGPEFEAGRWQAHYLVRGRYVFEVHPESWNGSLSAGYRERLLAGELTPEFAFPLQDGLLWAEATREEKDRKANAPDGFYYGIVSGRGGRGRAVTMNVSARAFVLTYQTVGGPVERWFEPGVGVAGEWDRHGGTYWENTVRLKQFRPAR